MHDPGEPNRSRKLKSSALTGLVVALVLLGATTAFADHFDSIFPSANYQGGFANCDVGELCLADNSTHTVFTGNLGTKMRTATHNTLDYSWDTTNIDVVYHSAPVYTGSSETDLIYEYNNALGSTTWGTTFCDDDGGAGKCDQFYIQYHGDKICPGIECDDASFLQSIACHETGHTFGLLHGSNSAPNQSDTEGTLRCMRTKPVPDDPTVGAHNVSQINTQY